MHAYICVCVCVCVCVCACLYLRRVCLLTELHPSAGHPRPEVEGGASEEAEPADASAQDPPELVRPLPGRVAPHHRLESLRHIRFLPTRHATEIIIQGHNSCSGQVILSLVNEQ